MKKQSSKKLQLVKIKIATLNEAAGMKSIIWQPTTTVQHTFDCIVR
jgi:hypothetical protein